MRIITLEEAVNQGSTPSELRVLANCLDRIANHGYPNLQIEGGYQIDTSDAYSPQECRQNAAALRRLAATMAKRRVA